jgi:hypothetical protein
MIRNKVLSVLDGMVSAGVAPAWKGMSTTVEELRPKIEPKIKELVDPIGKAEGELLNKLKEAAMSVINPLLEQHVVPHLSKIMEAMQKPMTDAYEEAYKVWDEQVGKTEVKGPKADLPKSFGGVDRLWSSSEVYMAAHKIDIMYEPLWALNIIFPDIYPWGLIYQGHNEIKGTTDCAVYTWEQKLIKAAEENEAILGDGKALNDKIRAEVLEEFKHDGKLRIISWYGQSIKTIISPPFNAVVIPATKAIITPIADAIPEPLREFIDIESLFMELLHSILDESINTVVGSGQK